MTSAPPRLLPNLALIGAILGVSTSALFIRFAESPALVIAAYRMVIVTALLAPLVPITQGGDLTRLDGRDRARLVGAGLFLAAHFGMWTLSLEYTTVAVSVLLVSTHPVLVALVEAVWLGRTLAPAGLAGIAMTVLGGIIIGFDELGGGSASLLGSTLALGGAASIVGYLIIGRSLRARMGFLSYSTPVYGVCALALLAAAIASGASLAPPARDVPIFLALAVLPTICGHTVFNWTLKHLPASVVATAFLGEPLGASLLAWLFLSEVPTLATLLGGGIVILGLGLTVRSA